MAFIIDSHQDLAYNAFTFGRDILHSAGETRRLEAGSPAAARNGHTLLGWPDYQKGQVAVIFATLFVPPARHKGADWETVFYYDYNHAREKLWEQVNFYRRLTEDHPEAFRLVKTRRDLAEVLAPWEESPVDPPEVTHPVGLVLLLEGAECIEDPRELEEWVECGLRIVGPVWSGVRYCGGSREPGGFRPEGYKLLEVMADLGLTLDLSHMNEESALVALDRYEGPIIASHSNAAALLDGDVAKRHLSDLVLRRLIERDGIVGVLPFNKFLVRDWSNTDPKEKVRLVDLVAHIDHICQIAGDARHVGIGTDFDGGFGWAAVPAEIDTIADLQKLAPLLAERGYSTEDIAAILGRNWQHHLEKTLFE